MKKLFVVTAAALFALAPGIGSACEYGDSAATTAAEQLGLAPAPAATKVPAPTVAKAKVSTPTKQVTAKVKATTSDAKVAAVSAN